MEWETSRVTEMCRISDRTVAYVTWYETEVLVMLCTHETKESHVQGAYTRSLGAVDSIALPVTGDVRDKIEGWIQDILHARSIGRMADLAHDLKELPAED